MAYGEDEGLLAGRSPLRLSFPLLYGLVVVPLSHLGDGIVDPLGAGFNRFEGLRRRLGGLRDAALREENRFNAASEEVSKLARMQRPIIYKSPIGARLSNTL
jgi:hypothetical protein